MTKLYDQDAAIRDEIADWLATIGDTPGEIEHLAARLRKIVRTLEAIDSRLTLHGRSYLGLAASELESAVDSLRLGLRFLDDPQPIRLVDTIAAWPPRGDAA